MHRKIFGYLLAFYAFFTLYNTLIPFRFDVPLSAFDQQLQNISTTPYFDEGELVSLTDIVGNVILFIPFGVLCFMFLYHSRSRAPFLLTVILGAILSTSIEFLQLFISDRNTAIHDLINNTLGSGIGAAVSAIYARQFSTFFQNLFYDLLRKKPVLLILLFFVMAQVVSAVMPFNVTISVSGLIDSVKESNLMPFAYRPVSVLFFDGYSKEAKFQINEETTANLQRVGVPPVLIEKLGEFHQPEPTTRRKFLDALKPVIGKDLLRDYREVILHHAMVRSQEEQFDHLQFIENIILWAIAGYLLMLVFSLYFANHPRQFLWLAGLPVAYFILIEFAQLFISSRISDINDIISGSVGVYFGYLLFRLFPSGNLAQDKLSTNMLIVPLILYIVFILFSGFRPFDWHFDYSVWNKDMTIGNLVPFYAYFRKTDLWNIYDLSRSLLFFFPLSLFYTFAKRSQGSAFSGIYLTMIVAGLFVGGLIEFTQLLSLSRIAEITDVIAYGMGGGIGVFAVYYYEKEILPKLSINN